MHPHVQVTLDPAALEALDILRSRTNLSASAIVSRLLHSFDRGDTPDKALTLAAEGGGVRHGVYLAKDGTREALSRAVVEQTRLTGVGSRSRVVRSMLIWCWENCGLGLEDDRSW
jgi:hypothetical protein